MGVSTFVVRYETAYLSQETVEWVQDRFEPVSHGESSNYYFISEEYVSEPLPQELAELVEKNGGDIDLLVCW